MKRLSKHFTFPCVVILMYGEEMEPMPLTTEQTSQAIADIDLIFKGDAEAAERFIQLLFDIGKLKDPRSRLEMEWISDYFEELFEALEPAEQALFEPLHIMIDTHTMYDVNSVYVPVRAGGDENPTTLMHRAAQLGCTDCLRLLIEVYGAEVDISDFYGRTPLFAAIRCGHVEAVQLLLEHRANINRMDFRQDRPLHYAAGKPAIIRLALQYGAEVDATDIAGETALHIFAKSGDVEGVRLLLKRGGAVNVRNNYGQTARDKAIYWGHQRIAVLKEINELTLPLLLLKTLSPILPIAVIENILGSMWF